MRNFREQPNSNVHESDTRVSTHPLTETGHQLQLMKKTMLKIRWAFGALTLVALGAVSLHSGLNASAAAPMGTEGGIVAYRLISPFDGQTVAPFEVIDWRVRLKVSPDDNGGLALFAFDFVQDKGNPALFNIPRALDPAPELAGFDQPAGFTNPGRKVGLSGYGGVGIGEFGAQDRGQIGGAQNTFGKVGPCFGQSTVICMGQDVDVDSGIGQTAAGVIVAEGSFRAPNVPGPYTFRIENMIANTLRTVNVAPVPSTTREATIRNLNDTFTFTVQ